MAQDAHLLMRSASIEECLGALREQPLFMPFHSYITEAAAFLHLSVLVCVVCYVSRNTSVM
eukprot:5347244-Amphidinium_carterae.1